MIDELIATVIEGARGEGRNVLLDSEGFAILRSIGVRVPHHQVIQGSAGVDAIDLAEFPGDKLVIKVATPWALHKTDVGGVIRVPKNTADLAGAVQEMEERFTQQDVLGYTVNEFVPHVEELGGELLLGARWTEDFGPVVTVAPGGLQAEFLADNLRADSAVAIFSPAFSLNEQVDAGLLDKAAIRLATHQKSRGHDSRVKLRDLSSLVAAFIEFASHTMPHDLVEFEVNPLVLTRDGPVALDVLGRLGDGLQPAFRRLPQRKIKNLLEPCSIAIVGVSERRNLGRIILENVAAAGFPLQNTHVVKPNTDSIDGVRCYPSLSALPGRVDLIVLSIAADAIPAAIDEIVTGEKAESVIVIPGGIGETVGTESLVNKIAASLETVRDSDWGGPVINGGNCVGIRSAPGQYDTTFLPAYKLHSRIAGTAPVALISQSGAFAASTMSALANLNPRYMISVGNQIDLKVGDYLSYLAGDDGVRVFACYVEGFRPGDGERWIRAAAEISSSGRSVILYRAGRTSAGISASASHTASIAGDYTVTRELARGAGVVVAETLADFHDLTKTFCHLEGKRVNGWRLGALSNAGFECVAMADNLGQFYPQRFDAATTEQLTTLFQRSRIDGIVAVQNPLDITPIADDQAYEDAVRAVLEAEAVDVGIVGCVPTTGALNTLPQDGCHSENLLDEGSIAHRLVRLRNELPKPWVAVVDGGSLYDPMVAMLEENGVPTFRTADRALWILGKYCQNRLESNGVPTTPVAMPEHQIRE